MKFFLCVLGMVMIIEGFPYFIAPEKMKNLIYRILQYDDDSLRQFGLSIMIFGLVLIYFGQY